jgi:hypothetical protein
VCNSVLERCSGGERTKYAYEKKGEDIIMADSTMIVLVFDDERGAEHLFDEFEEMLKAESFPYAGFTEEQKVQLKAAASKGESV